MTWALRILWREGTEEWFRDADGTHAVTAFATPGAATARRRELLEQMGSNVLGIDLVPYPPDPPAAPPSRPPRKAGAR